MECPSCAGRGCQYCDAGFILVEGCPNRECGDIIDAIFAFDLFAKGTPPIVGGLLDQSAWFVEAAQRLRHDEAMIKAE